PQFAALAASAPAPTPAPAPATVEPVPVTTTLPTLAAPAAGNQVTLNQFFGRTKLAGPVAQAAHAPKPFSLFHRAAQERPPPAARAARRARPRRPGRAGPRRLRQPEPRVHPAHDPQANRNDPSHARPGHGGGEDPTRGPLSRGDGQAPPHAGPGHGGGEDPTL